MCLWKNSDNLILEKPITNNHIKAKLLINILNKNKNNINYSLRYTKWFNSIYKYIHNNCNKVDIDIIWKFKGRHKKKRRQPWKTKHTEGGGVINYYGIDLIAILSDMGYSNVNKLNIFKQPTNKLNSWSSEFSSKKKLAKLNLYIDSYSNENIFCWQQLNQNIIELESPFSLESYKFNGDNRIPTTIKFLKDEYSDILNLKNMKVLELWSRIESMI